MTEPRLERYRNQFFRQVDSGWGGWAGMLLMFSLASYLVVTPHFVSYDIPPYDVKRILQIVVLLLAALVPAASVNARKIWLTTIWELPRWSRLALALFVLTGFASASIAADRLNAFLEVVHFTLLFSLAVSIASHYRTRPQFARNFWTVAIFVAVSVYVLAFFRDYAFSQLGLAYSFTHRPNALWPWGEFLGFANGRYFNQFQTWTLPIALAAVLMARTTRLGRTLLFLVPSFWWMLMFASGGRGTVLSVSVALLLLAVLAGHRYRRYIVTGVLTAAAGLILYYFLFQMVGDTGASLAERNLTNPKGRFGFWMHAFHLLQVNPFLGIGPGQYAFYHLKFAAHPHSSLVQVVSEWGVFAGTIAISLTATALWKAVRFVREEGRDDLLAAALLVSLLAGLGHSLISGLIVTPVSQLLMVIAIGWMWGMLSTSDFRDGDESAYTVTAVRSSLQIVVLVVLVVAEIGLTTSSYQRMAAARSQMSATGHKELPRFWVYGCSRSHEEVYPLRPED